MSNGDKTLRFLKFEIQLSECSRYKRYGAYNNILQLEDRHMMHLKDENLAYHPYHK